MPEEITEEVKPVFTRIEFDKTYAIQMSDNGCVAAQIRSFGITDGQEQFTIRLIVADPRDPHGRYQAIGYLWDVANGSFKKEDLIFNTKEEATQCLNNFVQSYGWREIL